MTPANDLIGRHILFKWPVVGWCAGQITERNMDARFYKKLDNARVTVNFLIYYEIDQQMVKTVAFGLMSTVATLIWHLPWT